jgi:hypothetical protein
MSHLIGVAVLIWIAVTYDTWTAIGFFVLYAIVVFGFFIGLHSIAAWWEERAWRRQEAGALSFFPDSLHPGWLFFAVLLALFMCVALWGAAQAQQYVPMFYPPSVRDEKPSLLPRVPLYLPPIEYDYPYTGKLTIERVTSEQLMARCSAATAISLGCAFSGSGNCFVLLVDDTSIKALGWTYDLLLRHELAHCNGWPAYHPGKKRPL